MRFNGSSNPFGSPTRTRILLALSLIRASYPRELSRLLGSSLNAVRMALATLERDALIVGRSVGRSRVYEINPSYFAREELRAFAARLADKDLDLRDSVAQLRRRPRRAGKPL